MSVKITCLQLDIAFGNPTKNRKYIEQKMTEALKENPDILVLPELWDNIDILLSSSVSALPVRETCVWSSGERSRAGMVVGSSKSAGEVATAIAA